MKKFLAIAAGLLCACAAFAGGPGALENFVFTTVTTNAAILTSTTNSVPVTAYLEAIVIDLGGYASPTCTVSVVTQGGTGSGPSRTLLLDTSITADTVHHPRDIADTTAGVEISNEPVRPFLVQDYVVVSLYNANVTNTITATVKVITSPTP